MTPSKQIDEMIASISDWRGDLLADLRRLINETEPNLTEDWKWSVPVWTKNGLICAISAFKDHVKINFFKGAHLPDPTHIFNSGLDSKDHRSINFAKNEVVNKDAIQKLIRAAVALNNK